MSTLLFEEALTLLRMGYRMAHASHAPKWVELDLGDGDTLSHLVLVHGHDAPREPWLPARRELIERGWSIVGTPSPAERRTRIDHLKAIIARRTCELVNGPEP